jgi:hypothetical protein
MLTVCDANFVLSMMMSFVVLLPSPCLRVLDDDRHVTELRTRMNDCLCTYVQ